MALGEIQTSLNSGELSPNLYARVDLAKFESGAALLRNFFVDYRGGVSNRAGTRFIAACKDVPGAKRLIPFTVSTEAAYVLEFGGGYVRVYLFGVLIQDLATPYIAADLSLIKFTQSADVLTLVHPNYAPANISRLTGLSFTYDALVTGPTIGPPTITTMVAPHSGPYSFGYLVTAVDLDGKEESLGSNPGVKHSEGMNEQTNRVIGLSWTAPADGVSLYNIYKWGPIDAVTMNPATVWGFIGTSQTTTFSDNNIAPDFSKQPPGWGDPFSGGQFQSITVATGGAGYNGVSGDWPTAIPYVPLVITGDGTGAAGYAVIDHALGTIIGVYLTNSGKNYTNATVTANGQGGTGATFSFTFSDPAPIFPACTAYIQQRRAFAGSDIKPETLVLSQTGLYNNFNTTPVSLSTDAIVLSIAGEEVNTIKAMVPVSYGLLLFTTSEIILFNGGTPYADITPSDRSFQHQSAVGANDLPPIRVNTDVLYSQNKGNRARALAFAWQKQSYQGSDISALAAHLFDNFTTTEWAYAEEPFKMVWAVRDDGKLLSLTYVPDQEVAAWCRHDTQGLFKSVCSISEGDTNAVYVIVERHIPNNTGDPCWVQYIERMMERQGCCLYDAWHLDAAVSLAKPTNSAPLYISPGVAEEVTLNTYDPCGTPSGDFGGQGNFPVVQGIQNFDLSTFTGGNYRDDICSVDWDNERIYIHSAANGLIGVVSTSTFANIVPAAANANYQFCMTVGENGFVYYAGGGGPNCTILHKAGLLTPSADLATFGVAGGPFQFVTDDNHWSVPVDMDVITTGSGNWMVSIAEDHSQTNNEVPVIDLDTMQWTGFSLNMDEPGSAVTRGSPVDSDRYGFAFTVGVAANQLGIGLYRVNVVPILSATKVKLMPASTFGPGWTHVNSIVGMFMDETDGNVICHASTVALAAYSAGASYFVGDNRADGGRDYSSLQNANMGNTPASSPSFWLDLGPSSATAAAIVKFTSYNGDVMWSIPIGAIPSTPNANMNCTRVRHGVYCYMDPATFGGVRSLVAINTLTGVATRTTEENLFADVGYYNDYTGQTIFSCSYGDLGPGHVPRPIGATPSSFSSYASLGKTTGFPAAAPPSVVGQVVQIQCGKVLITAQASATEATGTIISPLDGILLPDDPDGLYIPVASGAWSITAPATVITGLDHLNGKIVWALADAIVQGPFTVAGGFITLPVTASNVVVGLRYTAQIETLYLTMDDLQPGSIQGKRKLLPAATLRVDCTKGLKIGGDFDHIDAVPGLSDQELGLGELLTGDARTVIFAEWDEKGVVCIQQDDPLPASVLGIIIEAVPGDTGR